MIRPDSISLMILKHKKTANKLNHFEGHKHFLNDRYKKGELVLWQRLRQF